MLVVDLASDRGSIPRASTERTNSNDRRRPRWAPFVVSPYDASFGKDLRRSAKPGITGKLVGRLLSLGVYPEVSLKEARTGRVAARALLRAGTDPNQMKRLTRRAAAAAGDSTL